MTEPLTDAELERLEGQDWGHRNHRGLCIGCTRHFGGLHEWPCAIARLVAEVRRLRALLVEANQSYQRLSDLHDFGGDQYR